MWNVNNKYRPHPFQPIIFSINHILNKPVQSIPKNSVISDPETSHGSKERCLTKFVDDIDGCSPGIRRASSCWVTGWKGSFKQGKTENFELNQILWFSGCLWVLFVATHLILFFLNWNDSWKNCEFFDNFQGQWPCHGWLSSWLLNKVLHQIQMSIVGCLDPQAPEFRCFLVCLETLNFTRLVFNRRRGGVDTSR